jgi:hypothetical protein
MSAASTTKPGLTVLSLGKRDVYIKDTVMVSQDDESKEMRCGKLSTYFKSDDGKWAGVTTFELFASSWKKSTGLRYDAKDNIIGKKAYYGQWLGSQREDITSDATIIRKGGVIGTVIAADPHANFALVRVTDPNFKAEGGFWTKAKY